MGRQTCAKLPRHLDKEADKARAQCETYLKIGWDFIHHRHRHLHASPFHLQYSQPTRSTHHLASGRFNMSMIQKRQSQCCLDGDVLNPRPASLDPMLSHGNITTIVKFVTSLVNTVSINFASQHCCSRVVIRVAMQQIGEALQWADLQALPRPIVWK